MLGRLSEVAATCPHNRDSSKKFSSSAAEVSQKQLEVLNKGYFEVVRQGEGASEETLHHNDHLLQQLPPHL